MTQKSIKIIAQNPVARSNYSLESVIEAGMVLVGTEVKSLRNHAPNLKDSYVEVVVHKNGFEAWLCGLHIAPYTHGNIWNHLAARKRKLLLHARQLAKLYGAVLKEGYTLVPLKMYWSSGTIKLEIGLGKGKKHYDKRHDLKKKEADRQIERYFKNS